MPAAYVLLFALAGLLVAALVVRSVLAQRRQSRERRLALERLGFRPCPEEQEKLLDTVARIENNRGYHYALREPLRLPGERALYYYVKTRDRAADEHPDAEEEILFPLKRPSAAGLTLVVKPSSIPDGPAARMLGTLATRAWDGQPDDLQRLELPAELRGTNLVGALGPPGASLYQLVDTSTLSVVQGLGDAGGLLVRFRDEWCSVASTSAQMPFRLEEMVALIRPLL